MSGYQDDDWDFSGIGWGFDDGKSGAYWKKPLKELTKRQWESLCDGCGRCCLLKLEDDESGEVHYTDVSCRLFDPETCRCGNYRARKRIVKGCVVLSADNIAEIAEWMPSTCAYRLLHEGKDLPEWHPLISGRKESVEEAGISMRNACIPEYEIDEDELEDRVIEDMH